MKTHSTNSWLLASMLASASLCICGLVRADDPKPRSEVDAKPRKTFEIRSDRSFDSNPFGGNAPATVIRARVNQASAIRKAAEAVHAAKGEEAKSDAQKQLTKLLNEAYDMDMGEREKELKQIEERLTKLRELLDRRRAKKQDIIDLQVKVALNEAEGLGFSDSQRPVKANAYFYSGGVGPIEVTSGSSSGEIPSSPAAIPAPPAPPTPPVPAGAPH